jgi:hypothetical protein
MAGVGGRTGVAFTGVAFTGVAFTGVAFTGIAFTGVTLETVRLFVAGFCVAFGLGGGTAFARAAVGVAAGRAVAVGRGDGDGLYSAGRPTGTGATRPAASVRTVGRRAGAVERRTSPDISIDACSSKPADAICIGGAAAADRPIVDSTE